MTVEELVEQQTVEADRQASLENRIHVCTAAGCISCGSDAVRHTIADEIQKQGLTGKVEVCGTGCLGLCSRGPMVLSAADRQLYGHVTPADAPVDASGLVVKANLLIATSQNDLAMNEAVEQTARHYVSPRAIEEGMLNRVEAAIRCFDLCLSCSTHAVGHMPMIVELRGTTGNLIDRCERS